LPLDVVDFIVRNSLPGHYFDDPDRKVISYDWQKSSIDYKSFVKSFFRLSSSLNKRLNDGSQFTFEAGDGVGVSLTSLVYFELHLLTRLERLLDDRRAYNNCIEVIIKHSKLNLSQKIAQDLSEVLPEFSRHKVHQFSSRTEYLDELFSQYPVIAYYLYKTITAHLENSLLLISRYFLAQTTRSLKIFGIYHTDYIETISPPLGDPHCQGSSVLSITFSSGKKLIYKPTSLSLFSALRNIYDYASEKIYQYQPIPKHIDCGDYGWVEYIEPSQCNSRESVLSFFRSQGFNTALLYLLGGKDFIADNVIARSGEAILIDLECAISAIAPVDPENHASCLPSHKKYTDSVMRTGILPARSVGRIDKLGPIQSSLCFTEGDYINLPQWNGQYLDHRGFESYVISGFRSVYAFFEQEKKSIYDRILNSFSDTKYRHIIRHTLVYDALLNEAKFPEYWIAAHRRDKLFSSLWNAHNDSDFTSAIISSEIRQLWDWDIPYFFSDADKNWLLDGLDEMVCTNYFGKNAMENIEERLNAVSKEDCEYQVDLITRSFNIFSMEPEKSQKYGTWCFPDSADDQLSENDSSNSETLIAAAEAIAESIINHPNRVSREFSFVDANIGRLGEYEQGPKPLGIYDGLEGIGLFLLELHRVSPKAVYKTALNDIWNLAYNTLQANILGNQKVFENGNVSVFSAPLSILFFSEALSSYGFSYASDRSEYIRYLCVRWITKQIDAIKNHDLLLGSAGLIQLLLDLYEQYQITEYFDLALKCGENLVDSGYKTNRGLSWKGATFQDIGGFSHGTSGISWSLFRLAEASQNEKYYNAGIAALKFDRSFFVPKQKLWSDGRNESSLVASNAWCHGAAGIGLSRVLISKYYKDTILLDEVQIALDNVYKYGTSDDDCLCHGTMGNLEIVRILARFLGDRSYQQRTSQFLINRIHKEESWKCKLLTSNMNTYGLFTGLSGVGYNLVRFANWSAVPSLIGLSLPYSRNMGNREHLYE